MALFTTDAATETRLLSFDCKATGRDQSRLRTLNIAMRKWRASTEEQPDKQPGLESLRLRHRN